MNIRCLNCEESFYCKPSRRKKGEGKFCSMKCYVKYTFGTEMGYPKKRQCPECQKDFVILSSNERNRKFCSSSCSAKVANRNRAGITYKKKTAFRSILLQAYGHNCLVCGYSLFVDAHHILKKRLGGKDTLKNGVILCPNHHKEAESGIIAKEILYDLKRIKEESLKAR